MNKLIIVEGPQGVGKTTITDYIRNKVPYTNLLRLSGPGGSTKEYLPKVVKTFDGLFSYLKYAQNGGINILLDRFFFTEEVYCRLEYKEYSFTKYYKKYLKKLLKLNFQIIYINLYLSNEENYLERLKRDGKARVNYALFDVKSSIRQQNEYQDILNEISDEVGKMKDSSKINIYNIPTDQGTIEENLKHIDEILEIKGV